MTRITRELRVDEIGMKRNFEITKDKIIAEPLYILLAYHGHPDAHEYVRKLTDISYKTRKPLNEIALNDIELKPYLKKFTPQQVSILEDPSKYLGLAVEKTEKVLKKWKRLLNRKEE